MRKVGRKGFIDERKFSLNRESGIKLLEAMRKELLGSFVSSPFCKLSLTTCKYFMPVLNRLPKYWKVREQESFITGACQW